MSLGERVAGSSLYRAVWRWHFFAGLLILPVMVLLAVTGGAYLFKPEIDRALYRDLIEIPAQEAPFAPPSRVMAEVEHAVDGRVLLMSLPDRPDRSVRLIVRVEGGEPRTAFANPYDGRLLGTIPYDGVMQLVRQIHSLALFGPWANAIVEIAAGWAIVLVGTGVALWWPRGRRGGVITVRGAPGTRVFWRDIHAVTGLIAGGIILFLALTGMPWSVFWGARVQAWATAQNLNMPPPPAEVTPAWMLGMHTSDASHETHADEAVRSTLPWAVEQIAPAPSHDAHGGEASGSAETEGSDDIGIDRAVALLEAQGLIRPFAVQPADGPAGAYVGSLETGSARAERTIYLSPMDGSVIGDVGYTDYGPAAKAISWGIRVHQGTEYGPVNRWLMLAGCIAVVLLAVSAATMWWMRRPPGRLAVPSPPTDKRAALAVLGVLAVAGVAFPLVGASLLIALAVDRLVARFGPKPLRAG